jgi:hypothetical protein
MSSRSGYKYLEPEALARVKNLSMVARGVVEGSMTGLHASPYKGFSGGSNAIKWAIKWSNIKWGRSK